MVVGLLAGKRHFSDETDSLAEAGKPVGFTDRVVGKRPSRQIGQGVLYSGFGEFGAHGCRFQ